MHTYYVLETHWVTASRSSDTHVNKCNVSNMVRARKPAKGGTSWDRARLRGRDTK